MRRLAVIASHPIQYHAPLYRLLATRLDLRVFYAHRLNAEEQGAGFGVPFEWDIPLLEGYRYEWLENRARRPGVGHFYGCDTPGIAEIIRKGKFDVVLVNGWNLLCYWQAAKEAKRCGVPVMVRGDSQLLPRRNIMVRLGKRIFYPFLLGKFDAFLSVGKRHAEYLRHYGVPPSRIFSAPHCVDNDFFQIPPGTRRGMREKLCHDYGIDEKTVIFLFAGKLTAMKRPLDFLWALDELRRRGVASCGLVVGDGPLRLSLENHVRQKRTPCVFAGFRNQGEMASMYAASDALVLPSDGRETWGLVVNEAMACGLPAIVSDAAGCAPDLIIEGRTGFTYPCGNTVELAKKMQMIVEDPQLRKNLSGNVLEHIRSFSLEAACGGIVSAVEQVCRGGGGT